MFGAIEAGAALRLGAGGGATEAGMGSRASACTAAVESVIATVANATTEAPARRQIPSGVLRVTLRDFHRIAIIRFY
jgi:hypothetical protein